MLVTCLLCTVCQARVISGTDMEEQEMEENLCVLTFDDGPSIFTPQLLETLKQYEIHATFFMLGTMVNHYQDIALQVLAAGHEIATHTYAHKNLKKLSYDRQYQEIERGYASLAALGIIPTYMRPPYGNYDERTVKIADEFGLNVVLWSIDSKDWKRLPDDYGQLPSAHGRLEPGQMHGVFLFHDIHKRTVDDIPRVVEQLKKAGCERFVTFGEYMAGIKDPEPALMMTRHPKLANPTISTIQINAPAANSQKSEVTQEQLKLDEPLNDQTPELPKESLEN